jgi:hypothetical protein
MKRMLKRLWLACSQLKPGAALAEIFLSDHAVVFQRTAANSASGNFHRRPGHSLLLFHAHHFPCGIRQGWNHVDGIGCQIVVVEGIFPLELQCEIVLNSRGEQTG